tara:strand:- start:2033 stop:2392 length:360 start_codon:yes stop_codon:yes gene_type:complete
MPYIQKRNPIAKSPCGRRRAGGVGTGFKKVNEKALDKIVGELNKASKLHAGQADKIEGMLSPNTKLSPLNKISAACKSAAKRKFKVWPSAYASGWGVRCTRAGGPSRFGGGKKKKKKKK